MFPCLTCMHTLFQVFDLFEQMDKNKDGFWDLHEFRSGYANFIGSLTVHSAVVTRRRHDDILHNMGFRKFRARVSPLHFFVTVLNNSADLRFVFNQPRLIWPYSFEMHKNLCLKQYRLKSHRHRNRFPSSRNVAHLETMSDCDFKHFFVACLHSLTSMVPVLVFWMFSSVHPPKLFREPTDLRWFAGVRRHFESSFRRRML